MKLAMKTNLGRLPLVLQTVKERSLRDVVPTGLNKAAFVARKALGAEMGKVFDRPRPQTINSPFVTQATASDWSATLELPSKFSRGLVSGAREPVPAAKYLRAEILGGARARKKSEQSLGFLGVLPDGYYLVPTNKVKLDAYGNVSGALMKKMIGLFDTYRSSGASGTRLQPVRVKGRSKGNAKLYFAIKPGDPSSLPPGIYQRTSHGGHILLFVFVPRTTYKPRFDFVGVIDKSLRSDGLNIIRLAVRKGFKDRLSVNLR